MCVCVCVRVCVQGGDGARQGACVCVYAHVMVAARGNDAANELCKESNRLPSFPLSHTLLKLSRPFVFYSPPCIICGAFSLGLPVKKVTCVRNGGEFHVQTSVCEFTFCMHARNVS